MSLTLMFHPLSSFCHKVLIALYENDTPFTPQMVDLGDAGERAAFRKLWPVGKFPVLRDQRAADRPRVEHHHRVSRPALSGPRFIPADPELAHGAFPRPLLRSLCALPMQKIVGDRLRPRARRTRTASRKRAPLATALGMVDQEMASRSTRPGRQAKRSRLPTAPPRLRCSTPTRWCRLPTLSEPLAYLGRLKQRPSYARTLKEAEPYFKFFPKNEAA